MEITFAHISDCHVGSWRDPKMRELPHQAFSKAIERSIQEGVAFVLIAGDLFHTALPGIEAVKRVVSDLKSLQEKGIPVYLIPGSHDYSPSGRTMLDVLEKAGLCTIVSKGRSEDGKLVLSVTTDPKTGVKITGILGRRGMLDHEYYKGLDRDRLEQLEGFKIFMVHTAIEELKPKDLKGIDAPPLSLLPRGFNYYAAGHVHIVMQTTLETGGILTYPGPLFPDNFKEIEELGHGGFYLVKANLETGSVEPQHIPVKVRPVERISLRVDGMGADRAHELLMEEVQGRRFEGAIVTIRIHGKLSSGKVSDIPFKEIYQALREKEAYFIMRNTSKVENQEFEETQVKEGTLEEIETDIIQEQAAQVKVPGWTTEGTQAKVRELMEILSTEQLEGERKQEYETRLLESARKALLPTTETDKKQTTPTPQAR